MDQITQVVSWTDTLKDTAVGEQRRPWGGERIDDGLIDISGTPKAKKAPKADPARAARRKSPLTEDEKDQAKRKTELERRRLIAVYEDLRDELNMNNREIVDALRKRRYEISYANFQRHVQGNASVHAIARTLSKTQAFYDEMMNNPYMNMTTEQVIHAWFTDVGLPYHEFGVRSAALKEFAAIVDETYSTLWRWRLAEKIPTYAVNRIAKKVEKIKAGLQRAKAREEAKKAQAARTQARAST